MIRRGKRRLALLLALTLVVTGLIPPLELSAAQTPEGFVESVSENGAETETEIERKTDPGIEIETEAAIEYESQSINVNSDGTLSMQIKDSDDWDEDISYLKVDSDGKLYSGSADDYNLYYDKANAAITLNNFKFTSPALNADESNEYWSALFWGVTEDGTEDGDVKELTLVLVGENEITSPTGTALDIMGALKITGSGSLKAVTTFTKGTPDEEDPSQMNYVQAVFVGGSSFTNESNITVKAENDGDFDMLILSDWVDVVIKSGKIDGKVLVAGEEGMLCNGMVPYTTQWTDRSGFTYVGKAYYFTDHMMYPNHIAGDLEETEWRIIGKYDENGQPIPSNQYYQGYYIHKSVGPITNDFYYPVAYLVYGDSKQVDAQITANDIVDIMDGKTHTYNHDLYALHVIEGNAVVNGNVTLDLACFEQYGRIGETEDGNTIYERDDDGNIVYYGDSSKANATVNGDVGALSLNSSFKGNVSVTGNVNFIGYYDDINAEDGQPVPETYYGSMVSAGKVIDNGKFVAKVEELRGFVGCGIFEDTYYPKTETTMGGESVQGTSAPVGTDALLINVGANGIDETTYPCVREADDETLTEIRQMLTDSSSKVTAMDITLVQDDTKAVEPSGSVNLYIDNLTGFEKPALFHIKGDGTVEKLYTFSGSQFTGNITCSTNEFSTYFVAEDQELSILPNGPDTWKGKTGTEGFVLRLYNVAMGREADEAGFADWNGKLQTKKRTAAEVASGFIFSQEFLNAQYTDVQYVRLLYRTMFGREADQDGLSYWLDLLENGISREYVFRGFAESQEFTNLCQEYGVERGNVSVSQNRDKNPAVTGFVARLYTKMLGRSYDVDGLNDWCGRYASGMSIEEIATVGFLHSQELYNRNLSDTEFVTAMYQTFLDREPDEAGLQYWIERLQSGKTTRDNLVYGFTRSAEFANLKASFGLK